MKFELTPEMLGDLEKSVAADPEGVDACFLPSNVVAALVQAARERDRWRAECAAAQQFFHDAAKDVIFREARMLLIAGKHAMEDLAKKVVKEVYHG